MEFGAERAIKVFIAAILTAMCVGAAFLFYENDLARVSPKSTVENQNGDDALRAMETAYSEVTAQALHVAVGDMADYGSVLSDVTDSKGVAKRTALSLTDGEHGRIILSSPSGDKLKMESEILESDGSFNTSTEGIFRVSLSYTDAYGVSSNASVVVLIG